MKADNLYENSELTPVEKTIAFILIITFGGIGFILGAGECEDTTTFIIVKLIACVFIFMAHMVNTKSSEIFGFFRKLRD